MKKIILLAAATLMVTASLSAEPAKGAYVGLGFGSSTYNDGGYNEDLKKYRDRVAPTVGIAENYNTSGYKLYGGYQFNKVIAIEASYTDYGTYSLDYTNGNNKEMKPTAIGIAANIGYNIGEKSEFRPFAIIGLSSLSFNDSGSIDFYENSTVAAFRFGIGFEYSPEVLKGLGFRVAYEGDYYAVTSRSTASEFKDTYTQSTNVLYIGAQYKF